MKKKLILIFVFALSVFKVNAATYADMFNIVFKNRLYYSSYIFVKKSIATKESLNKKAVYKVLDTIHPSVYIHDQELDKFVNLDSPLNYAVGMRRFFLNDFLTAKRKLYKIKSNHPMYIESNYLLGLIYLTEQKQKRASAHFKRCVKYVSKKRKSNLKNESYIHTFRNRCIQQIARIEFTKKNYKSTLRILDYVKKDDYIWPRFLIDRAWSYYWLGENERALGSVMTYKAPLLRRFMVPEANYLRGLIYYEMCYFEKAENIYKEFNQTTWKFRKVAQTASRNRLLKLIMLKNPPKSDANKFLYYYLKGFKKDIRYFSFRESRKQLYIEIKRLSRVKSLKQARIFLDTLYFYNKVIKEDFQDFLKNLSLDYYRQIRQMRNAFVKLNLMVSLKKRKKISKENSDKFSDEYAEVSLNDIENVDDKFIWDFRGGFWADELGDYAVALKNRCNK
ncbi:MAG: hypothetical protein CME66_08515 [Halobacteriovoraceae bacterium]|nr:hypothetical protein [Halobacteriovoraceae bacterium]